MPSSISPSRKLSFGFSLVEVLVALVVISVGLLGIAKIQALAYASTSTAGLRSLAAIEAASLASAMRANRVYWSATPPSTFTVTPTSTSPGISDSTLATAATTADCTPGGSAPCDAPTLAAHDLKDWATALQQLLPNPTATITCPNATPINCTISLTWAEKTVAVNVNAANSATQMAAQTYTLYVEP